jgi:hypothetical protein
MPEKPVLKSAFDWSVGKELERGRGARLHPTCCGRMTNCGRAASGRCRNPQAEGQGFDSRDDDMM